MFSMMIGFIIAYVIAQVLTTIVIGTLALNPKFVAWIMNRYMKTLSEVKFEDEDEDLLD